MNINTISSINFRAKIADGDLTYNDIKNSLYYNYSIEKREIDEFERKLGELPEGTVEFNTLIRHFDKKYLFGTLESHSQNGVKFFVIGTNDFGNILNDILDTVNETFKSKSNRVERMIDRVDCRLDILAQHQ